MEQIPKYLDGTIQDDIAEVYSEPRISLETKSLGLRGELAADLLTDLRPQTKNPDFFTAVYNVLPALT